MIDLVDIKERFEGLKVSILKFVNEFRLPSVEGELIDFIQRCDKIEASIISMKTELGLNHALVAKDYSNEFREVYKRESDSRMSSFPKWEVDIIVEKESTLVDLSLSLQELKVMIGAMDDFKWLLKSRRDTATQSYEFLSGR
jgi:hypothetical protein